MCLFLLLILMAHTLFRFEKKIFNLKKKGTYCKNKSTLIAHCEKYPDQMIRCRSSLRRRYVHRGIFAFDVVKYWLVNEKRKCTSATSFEKRRLRNNWPDQHLVFF